MKQYALKNSAGMCVRVADIGATITELHVPDRNGRLADVVLGSVAELVQKTARSR